MKKLTEKEVLKNFGKGFDCSQVVLQQMSDKLNISNAVIFNENKEVLHYPLVIEQNKEVVK